MLEYAEEKKNSLSEFFSCKQIPVGDHICELLALTKSLSEQ